MSACLIIQEPNRIFIGSDSALSCIVDNVSYRVNNNEKKIFKFNNYLIFCSGCSYYVQNFIKFFNNIKTLDFNEISSFLKNNVIKREENIFDLELLICSKSKDCLYIHQFSQYNNFEPICYEGVKSNIRILSGGFSTKKSLNLATELIKNNNTVVDIYKEVFNNLVCEQIGGRLELWEFTYSDINKILDYEIPELNIKYLNTHSVVADAIIGRLIAGTELLIGNDRGTFAVSGSIVTITDLDLNMTSDNRSKIIISPTTGIEIDQQNPITGSFIPNFWVDANGNIIFTGNLSGASGDFTGQITANSGKIGAWTINNEGLSNTYGDYIYGNGQIRLGLMNIDSQAGTATFNGNIYANNLLGLLESYQIRSVNANVINTGTLRGIDIFGTRIMWPGVTMEAQIPGFSTITANHSVGLYSKSSVLTVTPDATLILNPTQVTIGDVLSGGQISLLGNIVTQDSNLNYGWGWTTQIPMNTTNGSMVLNFVNGILTDPHHYTDTSGSTSSGSGTSGSGVGKLVQTSNSVYGYWLDTFSYGTRGNQSFVEYMDNGIFKVRTTTSVLGINTSVSFYFDINYNGISDDYGTVMVDFINLDGIFSHYKHGLEDYNPSVHDYEFFVGGENDDLSFKFNNSVLVYPFYRKYNPGEGATGLICNIIGQSLHGTEVIHCATQFSFGEVFTDSRWQITKLYVRPSGGNGSSDIILWKSS